MSPGFENTARRLIPWLIRRRRAVLAAALLLTLLSGFYSAKLYGNLRSDLEELLPATAPSVLAAKSIGPKLHPVNNLFLVLDGHDPAAVQRFATDLAVRLRALGPDKVQDVTYRTDDQERFLERFGAFYLSQPDLRTILDRIRARVAWEKRRQNPCSISSTTRKRLQKRLPHSTSRTWRRNTASRVPTSSATAITRLRMGISWRCSWRPRKKSTGLRPANGSSSARAEGQGSRPGPL